MNSCLIATLGALGTVAGCARTGTPSSSEPRQTDLPIPSEFRSHIRKAEGIGGQLYTLDKVAAIATDVVMKRVPDFRSKGVGGYLPLREAGDDGRPKDSFVVTFFTADDPPKTLYEIRIKPNSPAEFEAFDPPRITTDSFASWVRARAAAIAALPAVRQPLNPILLPAGANDENGVLVYLIAGTSKPNVAVFGQHFRVLIPEDGGTPTYVMPLSRSAIEVPVTGGPDGGKPVGLMVTHLVTDWPLETHVLVSLQWRVPVYVGTRRGVWRVDGDRITLVSDSPPKGLR